MAPTIRRRVRREEGVAAASPVPAPASSIRRMTYSPRYGLGRGRRTIAWMSLDLDRCRCVAAFGYEGLGAGHDAAPTPRRCGGGLPFQVRSREIGEHLRARLGRPGGAAQDELPIAVDQPGEQDVDHVRIDRAAAAGLVRASVKRALLDLEVAFVGDRLGDIEQQEIIQEDIRVGGERFRRPIGLAVEPVPDGEAVLQALQEQGLQLLRDRERGLLVPQVT